MKSAWNINYKYKDTKTDRPTEKKTDRQNINYKFKDTKKQKKTFQFEDIQIKKKERDIMQEKQRMKK